MSARTAIPGPLLEHTKLEVPIQGATCTGRRFRQEVKAVVRFSDSRLRRYMNEIESPTRDVCRGSVVPEFYVISCGSESVFVYEPVQKHWRET
jgi:hypothetical protein